MRTSHALIPLALILIAGCGPPPAASTPTAVPTATPAVVLIIDDFQAVATDWQAGTEPQFSDSSALDVALTGEHASQGSQALRLDFTQDARPKAIFYLDRLLDLSQGRMLQFDLYHAGAVGGVGFALTSGPDSVWYESNTIPVEAGTVVTLSFDLTAANYKAASTNWEFRTAISDLDNVGRLAIIIFPAGDGAAILDNVRLVEALPAP